MRRKLTLVVDPPVAMITALRARILTTLPSLSQATPSTGPANGVSRWIEVIRCFSKNFDAGLFGRRGERMHEAVAGGHGGALVGRGRLAGLDQRPIHRRRVHFARNGIADRTAAEFVGRLVHEHHAMGDQKLVSRRAIVGEGADHLAVIEAVVGKAIRFDDGPVGQILEHEVGRILDAPFLLVRWCRRQAARCRRCRSRARRCDFALRRE